MHCSGVRVHEVMAAGPCHTQLGQPGAAPLFQDCMSPFSFAYEGAVVQHSHEDLIPASGGWPAA